LQFLCQFRPVFFIRLRDYSKSVNVAPFIVNYSGALFREFPGPWQVNSGDALLLFFVSFILVQQAFALYSGSHIFKLCVSAGAC